MKDNHWVILAIADDGEQKSTLHVEMASANEIVFDLSYGSIDKRAEAIADVCQVAPHMISLDSDLMEAYDDAFRTQPKPIDRGAVARFLLKYRGKITPETIAEMFS